MSEVTVRTILRLSAVGLVACGLIRSARLVIDRAARTTYEDGYSITVGAEGDQVDVLVELSTAGWGCALWLASALLARRIVGTGVN